mgnify:CR=1 FL=1
MTVSQVSYWLSPTRAVELVQKNGGCGVRVAATVSGVGSTVALFRGEEAIFPFNGISHAPNAHAVRPDDHPEDSVLMAVTLRDDPQILMDDQYVLQDGPAVSPLEVHAVLARIGLAAQKRFTDYLRPVRKGAPTLPPESYILQRRRIPYMPTFPDQAPKLLARDPKPLFQGQRGRQVLDLDSLRMRAVCRGAVRSKA